MKTKSFFLISIRSFKEFTGESFNAGRNILESIGGTIFLTDTLAFLFSISSAQTINTPTISWQKPLGGSGDDVANCIRPTSDGGFIIAGTSDSNDGDITDNHGQDDFCLIKLNAAGDLIWQQSYGGTGGDEAISVVPTLDGGYAVAGKSSSNDSDITGNHGSSDYWLIKTNDQGIMQWQKLYGGSQADVAYFMEPTSDNGFVLAGISYSNDGDVSGNHGMGDAWIIKVDQNGNLLWQKTIGGSKLDIANDIKQSADGGYIVTGYSLSNDGDITVNKGQEDFLFFKLDANGNLQWEKTMGGSGGDCGSAGVQTIDGGYVFCGLTHSRDSDVVGHHSGHDMWVIKTNSTGVAQWTHCLGGSDADNGLDIKQQADGTILACGYTGSDDGDVTGLHGSHDIWLTALDTSGNLLWQKTLGGSNYEYPRSLQVIPTGYIIAGKTNSNDGDVTENHGNYDCWIVKLNAVCSTVFYIDDDGDGYGNPESTVNACIAPSGYVADHTDCNDSPANGGTAIHPGASDICNSIDDNCDGTIDENAITAIVTPGGTVSKCTGVSLTLTANSGSAITYQWKKGNTDVAGATNQTYSTSAAAKYKVFESNSFGCSSTSSVTTISTIANPTSTIIPRTSLDICNTDSVVLQATGGSGLTYQWQKAASNIAGATNQSYTAAAKATYKVIVTNSSGCSKTSAGTKVTKSCKENSIIIGSITAQLLLYPNPSAGKFIVELMTEDVSAATATIEVFSEIGQRVYQEIVPMSEGNLHQEVQLQNSALTGIYFVRVVVNNQVYKGQISY